MKGVIKMDVIEIGRDSYRIGSNVAFCERGCEHSGTIKSGIFLNSYVSIIFFLRRSCTMELLS
jgi:hypothetical protein